MYLEKKTHYPISNLFLIVLLYIVEAKKGCKKKSLNILSLAADLLKPDFNENERWISLHGKMYSSFEIEYS